MIKDWWLKIAEKEKAEVMLVELGGTIGDMENELYVEAIRQLKKVNSRKGRKQINKSPHRGLHLF